MPRAINPRALAAAFFGFYVLPLMVFYFLRWVLGLILGDDQAIPIALDVGVALFWVWVFAPIGAGYVAAKLSRSLPLWHGVLVAAVGVLFQALFFQSHLIWVWLGLIMLALSSGLFGAWLWRYRTTRTA